MALPETRRDGNEKDRTSDEGTQNQSIGVFSSSLDLYVNYILWIWQEKKNLLLIKNKHNLPLNGNLQPKIE